MNTADWLLGRTFEMWINLDNTITGLAVFTVYGVNATVVIVRHHGDGRRHHMGRSAFVAGVEAGIIVESLAAPFGC